MEKEKDIIQEIVEDEVKDVEDSVEETTEEQAAEDSVEETTEEQAAEEVVEETIEEQAAEEVVEETAEEQAAEEVVEETAEKQIAEEVVEEIAEEEPPVKEIENEQVEKSKVVEEAKVSEAPKAEEPSKERKGLFKKWWAKLILIIIIVIAGLYAAGVYYFQSHFYINETVFGVNTQFESIESLNEKIQENINKFQLTVLHRNGKEIIHAREVGLTFDDAGQVKQLMEEQNKFQWPIYLIQDYINKDAAKEEYDVEIVYNKELFEDTVKALSIFDEENINDPVDAYLAWVDDEYEIIPEDAGNRLNQDKAIEVISNAFLTLDPTVSMEDEDCYVKPNILSDNETLVTEMNDLNAWLNVEITIDFGDRQEYVGSEQIIDWIIQEDGMVAGFKEDKISEYVQELADKYDTFGEKRTFTTTGGQTIELSGGDYGYLMGIDATTELLINTIKAGENATIEPIYRYSGVERSTNDIGGTYVEISISQQMMWCYKDGNLIVSTPVVTGNPNKGNETPAGGVWAIDAKKSPATLGTMETMGYSSDVTYWMPFNVNVGIHDADGWRTEYGGDIYLSNGSHGCVNTPLEACKIIYETVEIGSPVVVY